MKYFEIKDVYKNIFLNEAIIQQNSFVERLEDICFRDIKKLEVGVSSKEEFLKNLESSFLEGDSDARKRDYYLLYLDDIEKMEVKRKKEIDIKRKKGLDIDDFLKREIVFDRDDFEKQWDLTRKLEKKEKNVIVEILKCQHVIRRSGLDIDRKKKEDLIIQQCRKHRNIDGTFIELRSVLPLYDSIIKYLETRDEVSAVDCILAGDLYIKNFYKISESDEKRLIDLGNFDFNFIFHRINFYKDFYEKYNVKKQFVENVNYFKVFENSEVIVVLPFTGYDFKSGIKSFNANVSWCTQKITTWKEYNERMFLCLLHSKNVDTNNVNYLISLKVKKIESGVNDECEIIADETCDYLNLHMDELKLLGILSEADISEIQIKLTQYSIDNNQINENITETEFLHILSGLIDLNDIESINYFIESQQLKSRSQYFDYVDYIYGIFKSFDRKEGLFVEAMSEYASNIGLYEDYITFKQFFEKIDRDVAISVINKIIEKAKRKASDFKYSYSLLNLKYLKHVPFEEDTFKIILRNSLNGSNNNNHLYNILTNVLTANDSEFDLDKEDYDIGDKINFEKLLLSDEYFDIIKNTRLFKTIFDIKNKSNFFEMINFFKEKVTNGYSLINRYYFNNIDYFNSIIFEKCPDMYDSTAEFSLDKKIFYIDIMFKECDFPINEDYFFTCNIDVSKYEFLGITQQSYINFKKKFFNNEIDISNIYQYSNNFIYRLIDIALFKIKGRPFKQIRKINFGKINLNNYYKLIEEIDNYTVYKVTTLLTRNYDIEEFLLFSDYVGIRANALFGKEVIKKLIDYDKVLDLLASKKYNEVLKDFLNEYFSYYIDFNEGTENFIYLIYSILKKIDSASQDINILIEVIDFIDVHTLKELFSKIFTCDGGVFNFRLNGSANNLILHSALIDYIVLTNNSLINKREFLSTREFVSFYFNIFKNYEKDLLDDEVIVNISENIRRYFDFISFDSLVYNYIRRNINSINLENILILMKLYGEAGVSKYALGDYLLHNLNNNFEYYDKKDNDAILDNFFLIKLREEQHASIFTYFFESLIESLTNDCSVGFFDYVEEIINKYCNSNKEQYIKDLNDAKKFLLADGFIRKYVNALLF